MFITIFSEKLAEGSVPRGVLPAARTLRGCPRCSAGHVVTSLGQRCTEGLF